MQERSRSFIVQTSCICLGREVWYVNKTYFDQINQNTRKQTACLCTYTSYWYPAFFRKKTLNYINAKQTFRKGQVHAQNKLKDKFYRSQRICQHTQALFKNGFIYEKPTIFVEEQDPHFCLEYLKDVDTVFRTIVHDGSFNASNTFLKLSYPTSIGSTSWRSHHSAISFRN